jgi:hypothetical protein
VNPGGQCPPLCRCRRSVCEGHSPNRAW